MDGMACDCGYPLHWNYLRGTFECDQCHRVYHFHAGQLILMEASRTAIFPPASG